MASSHAALPAYARADDLHAHWHATRARTLKPRTTATPAARSVLYWMSRDQRAHDNWALLHAQQLACAEQLPLHVVFCLQPNFLGATIRHFGFMLKGLAELEPELGAHKIQFHLLRGDPAHVLPSFAAEHGAHTIVCDFSPLRIGRKWKEDVAGALPACTALVQVDAHNVVPVWHASNKQEVGARTLRPKIERLLPTFLTEFPKLRVHPFPALAAASPTPIDWAAELAGLGVDRSVAEVDWCVPGERAAHAALAAFVAERLKVFGAKRNDPNADALSNLSPYYHFGQLAPQRGALAVRGARAHAESAKSFIEESVVRRELADNYCYYNPSYDSLDGAADWARASLELHAPDKREFVYSQEQLDKAQTHDPLWNGAQRQMALSGKMHGFMRMYWAKKILEWTESPAEALRIANHLNDRYELDGRDPNGYVGVAWSIMGVHDMGWAERPVFGKIRCARCAVRPCQCCCISARLPCTCPRALRCGASPPARTRARFRAGRALPRAHFCPRNPAQTRRSPQVYELRRLQAKVRRGRL